MSYFTVAHNSINIPLSLLRYQPIVIATCAKAIAITVNSSNYIDVSKLARVLSSELDITVEEVLSHLSLGLGLQSSTFVSQAIIPKPVIKVTKQKTVAPKNDSINSPEFVAELKAAYPKLDITECIKEMINSYKGKYVISQNSVRAFLERKNGEEEFLQQKKTVAKYCDFCGGSGRIKEFIIGVEQVQNCPACSE